MERRKQRAPSIWNGEFPLAAQAMCIILVRRTGVRRSIYVVSSVPYTGCPPFHIPDALFHILGAATT